MICGGCGHTMHVEARGADWRRWICEPCRLELVEHEGPPPDMHCWAQGPRLAVARVAGAWVDDCGTTCMRELGHEGPHWWERDDEIVVTVVERAAAARGGAA